MTYRPRMTLTSPVPRLTAIGLLAIGLYFVSTAAAEPATRVAVSAIAVTVSDMARVLPFYTNVLNFEVEHDVTIDDENLQRVFGVEDAPVRMVTLKLGSERLRLLDFLGVEGKSFPTDTRSNDLWFQHIAIIVSDMHAAYRRLQEHEVPPASRGGSQRLPDWNKSAGGIEAYYFRDPDGHFLEILSFPPGKGDPRWQAKDRLFLGIDHTAIVVSDTDAILTVYSDLLGMKVIGTSENYGPEQERLNNVFGARLRITTVKGVDGPAIEFLEYLSPSTGRPAPPDLLSNDLAHWHIVLASDRLGELEQTSRATELNLISPGIVSTKIDGLPFSRALLARDRDRHALLLTDSDQK